MFKVVDIETSDIRIQTAWRGLQRIVQTVIEHVRVFNDTGVAMARGDVVQLDTVGNRTVALAQSGASITPFPSFAVVCEAIPDGGSGIARYQGETYCAFDDVPGLVGGTPAYLSAATPGRLTNIANGDYVGIISNAADYVTVDNHFAYVIVNRCCAGAQNAPG